MKKIISLAVTLVLILQALVIPAMADDAAAYTFTIESKSVQAGDEIVLSLTAAGTVPITSMAIANFTYDADTLELVELTDTDNDIINGSVVGQLGVDQTKMTISIGYMPTNKQTVSGKICGLKFKVKADAPCGDHTVTFAPVVKDGANEVSFSVESGTVSLAHTLTAVSAKVATCKEEGNKAYWTCSGCGKLFADAEGKTEITDPDSVKLPVDKVNGHQWDDGILDPEPTQDADGVRTYTCLICGDKKTENVPFHCEHENLEHIEAKEATCSAAGNTEYWKCTKCNKLFSDAQAQNEITEAETVKEIVATAHVWGDWAVTTDPTCEDKGVETRTCTLDPTHTETRDVEALGHDWDEPTYTWDGNNVKAARVCKRDATHEETETVEAKEEVIAPTCEEGGKTVLKATFENLAFKEQTKDVEGSATEALGHDFGDPTFTWNYDYSATATFVCKRDPSHKEVKAATVTSKTEDNQTTYTAEVTFNGKTYTAKQTVQNRPQSNGYVYIPGINGGAFGTKKSDRPTREPDPVPGTKTAAVPAPVAEPAIPQVVNELPFIDVYVTDAYYDAVKFVYDNGLFKGVSDKEFDPSGTMTRAMFVTVLGRLAKVDVSAYTESSFTDVEPIGTWNYAPYVEWAAQKGIVLGYGDGRFGPNDLITKEQAAVIIARYAKYTGADTSSINTLAGYADGETVSDWAFDAVAWADDMNIYVLENGLLNPQAPASRAVVAMMLWAYVK